MSELVAESKNTINSALLSVPAAAQYLGGVAEITIRRLIERKELSSVRVGYRLFLEKAELDKYIEKNRR